MLDEKNENYQIQYSNSTKTESSSAARAKSANTTANAHQYSAHYTGSSSNATEDGTRPRRHHEMSALDRLKLIQQNFK